MNSLEVTCKFLTLLQLWNLVCNWDEKEWNGGKMPFHRSPGWLMCNVCCLLWEQCCWHRTCIMGLLMEGWNLPSQSSVWFLSDPEAATLGWRRSPRLPLLSLALGGIRPLNETCKQEVAQPGPCQRGSPWMSYNLSRSGWKLLFETLSLLAGQASK